MYFPGVMAAVQGDIPLLDAEMPAANGVATARGLARMYGAIANGGEIDGTRFLSRGAGCRADRPAAACERDRNLFVPLSFHLGYHSVPFGNVMPGFGHVGLGGSFGWADPASGLAFAFVHNRLLTPFVVTDHAGSSATLGNLIRQAAQRGPQTRLPAGDRVRGAVLRAGSRRRLIWSSAPPIRPSLPRGTCRQDISVRPKVIQVEFQLRASN